MTRNEQERVEALETIGIGDGFVKQPRSRSAFLGISLDRPITDYHLGLYIRWASAHTKDLLVVIDDIEFRHNYVVFDKMDEESAKERSIRRGESLSARISNIIELSVNPYQTTTRIKNNPGDEQEAAIGLRKTSENLLEDRLLAPLTIAYEEDRIFRQTVNEQVTRGLGKKLVNWSFKTSLSDFKLGRERLAKFVLEETAVTIGIIQRGYPVELYAGSPIQVVLDLYDPETNKFPELREALNIKEEYGHVSLGIKEA